MEWFTRAAAAAFLGEGKEPRDVTRTAAVLLSGDRTCMEADADRTALRSDEERTPLKPALLLIFGPIVALIGWVVYLAVGLVF